MALDRGITLALRRRDDQLVRVASGLPGYPPREFELAPPAPYAAGDWGNYVKAGAGAAMEFATAPRTGMDAYVWSNLPVAAGLSSSSALVVAVLLALLEVNGRRPDRVQLMRAAARAERFVGTEGGGMDQAICLGATAGSATRIEFDPLTLTPFPIPATWRWLVAFSGIRAAKSAGAQAAYNQRTAECREALRIIAQAMDAAESLPTFRKLCSRFPAATVDTIGVDLPDPLDRRYRHVVRETRRVDDACAALRADDPVAFGRLMVDSHASLRDDYTVSSPELDALVDAALAAGALGARLTGAGFGGCIVALTTPTRIERVRSQLARIASASSHPAAEVFEAMPSAAARVERIDAS